MTKGEALLRMTEGGGAPSPPRYSEPYTVIPSPPRHSEPSTVIPPPYCHSERSEESKISL